MAHQGCTDTLNLAVSLPAGESGPAEIIVSIWDIVGAEDQDAIEGTISPPP